MKGSLKELLVATLMFTSVTVGLNAQSASVPPLMLVKRMPAPGVTEFDHLGADSKGNRLFSCAEAEGRVEVFNLRTGELIHEIGGLQKPHSLFYREDTNRLFVVDGNDSMGAVRVYDGKDYSLIKTVNLPPGADWSTHSEGSPKEFYVTANGDVLQHPYSTVSVVDTTAGSVVAEIKVDGDSIGGLAVDASASKLYLGNKNKKNEIDVVDLTKRDVVAKWPVTLGKKVGPIVIDVQNQRLYVGCRSGDLVIFDTSTGKELQSLPISLGVDDLSYDTNGKRLYANGSGGDKGVTGTVDVYEQIADNRYKSLGRLSTAPGARNGMLVQDAKRYFVEAPPHDGKSAEILVYEVQ